jgi:hypothetical protein
MLPRRLVRTPSGGVPLLLHCPGSRLGGYRGTFDTEPVKQMGRSVRQGNYILVEISYWVPAALHKISPTFG